MNRRPPHVQSYAQSGFTLVELLVSMTLFIIVLSIASGALLALVDANEKSQRNKIAMDSVAFAVESMTREIRTGTNYYCGDVRTGGPVEDRGKPADHVGARYHVGNFPNGSNLDEIDDVRDCTDGEYISVIESGNSLTAGLSVPRVTYYVFDNRLWRLLGDPEHSVSDYQAPIPLTPPEVTISNMSIHVMDTDPTDQRQPRALLLIQGDTNADPAVNSNLNTEFTIQTTVTQRMLDV